MENSDETLEKIKEASKRKIRYLPHAVRQMSRPDRMIGTREVSRIIAQGQVIEDYPDDVRGHTCLIMGVDKVRRGSQNEMYALSGKNETRQGTV
jgi:hypothetical protein